MTERNVTVRLRMVARDYLTGTSEAERMTRRLAAAQQDLAGTSRQAGDELDGLGRRAESSGRRTGRGMLYAAAGVAALGAAGGGLKVLPGLLSATAVAGAALPPMLLGTAAAGGVLITSLKGVGKAAGEVLKSDDPFAGLGRNARAFVAEVKAVQPAMSAVRRGFQDRALEGAARNLRVLSTEVLPQVRGGLDALASDWSEAFTQITASVMDPRFQSAFTSATLGADWFFDMINARIPATVVSISTLIRSADPLARAFGQSMINSLDRFNAAIERAASSGRLAEFFADGARGAGAFLDLAQDVLALTGMVIREVQAQGGTLEDSAAALNAYLASGAAAEDVAGIVHTLTTAYEGLRDVLGPLGTIAREALADPGTAAALATMFDVLAAGSRVLLILFNAFQLLPDSMQATVLAGLALALVVGKLTKAFALLQVGAGRAAASLTATGAAGARAGRALTTAAGGVGRFAAALVGLQIAGVLLDQFDGAAPDVEALGRSLEKYAAQGKLSGEVTRLFGENLSGMEQAARGASDGWFPKLNRSIEELIPPAKSLNEIFFGGSFSGDVERFKALDAALSQYARTTGDLATTQDVWRQAWQASGMDIAEFEKLLPAASAELEKLQASAHAGADGMTQNSERAKLLAGSFQEAAFAGKDLAATMDLINGKQITAIEGQIRLEEAYDRAKEVLDEYGRVTRKGTHEIDLNTEAGRQSMQTLIGIEQAAVQAADAEVKRTGNTAAGIPILNAARERFIALATGMTGSASAARKLADEIFGIPSKDIAVTVETAQSIADLEALGYVVKRLPNGKHVIVDAKTAEAKAKLKEAKAALDRINDKSVTVTVRTRQIMENGNIRVHSPGGGHGTIPRARGGVSIPYGRPIAAAMGLVRPDIYAASDPPLYQFAERETGGELFLPRRGIDRGRGRALLAIAASWYDGMFVPMRSGGVRAAASGLVSVGPASGAGQTTTTGGRLDYVEAYIAAKDAVAALNAALKDNGRSFRLSSAAGRENQRAVNSVIRAAQEAARAKYEETGSVRAANKVYDQHIAALRRTLAQQKVNATTINQLINRAGRPIFAAVPVDSSANIAFVRQDIAVRGGLGELADALSLNRPEISVHTEAGRANLAAVISFLESAGSAAQARYQQTRNAAEATRYYEELVAGFRDVLAKAGYSADMVDRLLSQYGRITITPNRRGGVYMAAAGGLGVLSGAAVYPAGDRPMYGWAEKGTGGELFLPRHGERARGERLLAVGAGWYGGRYTPAGAAAAGPTTVNNNLTVNAQRAELTLAELQGLMRQMDVEARVGRRR